MTDRELLELAAKAVGLSYKNYSEKITDYDSPNRGAPALYGSCQCDSWNPLTNDGDNARMEATLMLSVEWFDGQVLIRDSNNWLHGTAEFYKDHAGDRQAARRLASTRLAAEIGKMKGER